MAIDLPRETALKILYEINENGAYSNIAINKYMENHELRDIDKAFVTDLVYGSVKWRLSIDWVIQQFSTVKLRKISPWIINILRLGVYQLLYTDKIPPSAACNESVGLSKRYGHAASSGFVNAVLRNIVRNKENIKFPDRDKELVKYLSVKYSHPEWMVKSWVKRFGADFTESLLESNNQAPELTLRVNTLKITSKQLLEHFAGIGLEVEKGRHVEEAVLIKGHASVANLEAFQKGWFQVQDESSMLVGKVLDPQPGELIMDVCSAPGGKSTHLAQLMKNNGTVISRDIHPHKIKLIEDAAARLGLDIVKTEIYDATQLDERYVNKADRVLVDAPCTGLGIIRRKPDIKWARNMDDKKEITVLQEKILSAASKYVKPGGVLVYSTCTIEPEENEEAVKKFAASHKGFELVDISAYVPHTLAKPTAKEGYIQIFPNIDGSDGFFIAKMRKSENE